MTAHDVALLVCVLGSVLLALAAPFLWKLMP